MVNIKELMKRIKEYDDQHAITTPDHSVNRDRLCALANRYGFEVVALATGFNENTVKQHCRNRTGTALISSYKLDRAEAVLYDM